MIELKRISDEEMRKVASKLTNGFRRYLLADEATQGQLEADQKTHKAIVREIFGALQGWHGLSLVLDVLKQKYGMEVNKDD